DRGEAPGGDAIYMAAGQARTGGGGWPMSVWLTPEREPFFGGTYFPPRDGMRGARRRLLPLLEEQGRRFREDPGGVAEDAQRLGGRVRESLSSSPAGGLVGGG